MIKPDLRRFVAILVVSASFVCDSTYAQTFYGTNVSGAMSIFNFSTGSITNISLTLPGSPSAYSHLLLRSGSAPSDLNFDFISQLNNQTNSIHLETPELLSTTYFAGVSTPVAAPAHTFSLLVESNRNDLRTAARPVSKFLAGTNSGLLPAAGSKHFFRFEIPTNTTAWKIGLSSVTNSPDLFVQRGQVPSESAYLKRSINLTNDTISFVDGELLPGAYFVGVFSPTGSPSNVNYTLLTETPSVTSLTWDLGTTHEGTSVYTNQSSEGGDFFFKIRTANPSLGAWRTSLNVTAGEADVYLSKGVLPSINAFNFKSDKPGSDGFVLSSTQFNPGEDWYILVRAGSGSQWTLVTGAPFVTDLGVVSADSSSGSGDVLMGPEGFRFFQTTVPGDTLAWRLWLNGMTNSIYLKKTSVPLPNGNELSQASQMLVVPPYLAVGQLYFIGVSGTPGSIINLDSRQQSVTDIPFSSITNIATSGFGYSTYRVQVPPEQIAWQINVAVTSGNPNIAVRRNLIPNELNNDAYSEVAGSVTDSVTLVPPVLSDGTFYITVYSTNSINSFSLQNGPPVVTDINYATTITNDDPNRVGWRFYRVTDINQQLGSLGWELLLTNFSAGTKIALRRNSVPGIWNARTSGSISTSGYHDFLSATEFLQRPAHQADIWYVGVYNPTNAFGSFTLITRELSAEFLAGDGGTSTRSNAVPGRWEFFRVDVPSDILGWDIRLTNVSAGLPKMVIRRELLPTGLTTSLGTPATATNWSSGAQWASSSDWSERSNSADGTTNQDGRVLAMGMGRPLQSATYYIGVINSAGTNAMSYTISSRFIGDGRTIPVANLAYADGVVTNLNLAPREAAYYRIVIPPDSPSWKVRLTPTVGEVMMVASTNRIPNVASEKRVQKLDKEHYLLLPRPGQTSLSGTNYLVVVSEGINPVSNSRIGTGASSYVLESLGGLKVIGLGTLIGQIETNGTLEGGESTAYQFAMLPSLGFEIKLEDRVGNPYAVARGTFAFADPGLGGDTYGNEGGETSDAVSSPFIINASGWSPQMTLMLKARALSGVYPDAAYTLKIREHYAEQLTFDAGVSIVANQSGISWKFFRVEVPTNALGWDIRVTNVLSGDPAMVIARDVIPVALTTFGITPTTSTNWPFAARWAATKDWTGRSLSAAGMNEDGRTLAMGMGRPLQAGTYYVGVINGNGASDLSYTLISRGIGDGMAIPVQPLDFVGGTTTSNLPVREAAFYRFTIPTNTPSWKLDLLTGTNSEMALVVAKGAIPNVLAGSTLSGMNTSAGRRMQKFGNEHYLMLPVIGQTNLAAGDYYVAAIAEGENPASSTRVGTNASTFALTSSGPLSFLNLGTLDPLADLVQTGMVAGGESVAYQFTVPPGTLSLEARLENRVGNPVMVMRPAARSPDPGMAGGGAANDTYGNEGGETAGSDVSATFINAANPTPGTYFVVIMGRLSGTNHPDASFTLRLNAIGAAAVDFNSGSTSITNHSSGSWRYFRIEVPTNALGWDVRLTNVTAGLPKLVVRRDALPGSLTSTPWSNPGSAFAWPSSNQWAAAADWTRRANSTTGSVNEDGRVLAMGMGRPLEPGTYYVGVLNAAGSTNAMTYSLCSRGIGPGFSIPLVDLAFNGNVTNFSLAPREAAYYRVVIPSNSPSWKVNLSVTGGEAMMAGLFNRVPNIDSIAVNGLFTAGRGMQKAGNEQFLQLPVTGQINVPAGTNFFVVVGEGINPASSTRIGAGHSSYILKSQGSLPVVDLGTVTSTDLERLDSLEGGEAKAYQFAVPVGALGVEVRLEDRIGNPIMMMRPGNSLPDPGATSAPLAAETYGNEGGYTPTDGSSTLLTIPNPVSGTYSLMVKARALGGNYSDASFRLRVREVLTPVLNFSPDQNTNGLVNTASGVLENNQRAFFQITVPATNNGAPVIGWKLEVTQSSGLATLRVRKGALPSDAVSGTMPFTQSTAIIAPPFLTNGVWYVEVKGSNSTAFTLTSRSLELERPAWIMPAPDETNSAPGLVLPLFGDTGLDTNGLSIGGDQSLFLEQGNFHYYGVLVSTQNLGVMRVQLEGISGNPDVYLRIGSVPTLQHSLTGGSGAIFDRSMLALTTEYANWVPLDGKTETKLKPGFWYLAVRAAGNANARYRLRVSLGNIQDVPLDGASLTHQILAGGDWRYYRVQIPTAVPLTWRVTFSQQAGDVVMYLRDTVPPGNGNTGTDYKNWATDVKNSGPYASYSSPGTYSFNIPPIRPGGTYYVGFRAAGDATFSMSTATNGIVGTEVPTIDFYGGNVSLNMPAFSQLTYRIDVPADATRWKHSSIHATNLLLFVEQGTLPSKSAADDWKSSGTNSVLNQYLLTAWPWIPNQSYYLTVTNTSASVQFFSFTMDGRNAITDDNDNDLMPDAWELEFMGSLSQTASGDFDLDGISNLVEWQEGTNPADRNSYRPRLTITAINGIVARDPNTPSYALGSFVTLTPSPNPGYAFVNWSGQASGSENPLLVNMNTNKIINAIFKVIGDEFSTRVPLSGASGTALGINVGASKETGEPNHHGNAGGKSIWWTWVAPATGNVTVSTMGSSFNTLLAVYTGSVPDLSLVASDNNSLGGTNRSRVTFGAVVGTTYQIAVDGFNGSSGNVVLALNLSGWSKLSRPTVTGNQLQFILEGEANRVYLIDSSSNLVNWTTLGTVTNVNGTLVISYPIATNLPKGFYRVRSE